MSISLNSQTYDNLKRDIMTLELPPGEPVSAAKIADRYQVSRTPAREALVKLETEGLVEIYPQSASVISKIDSQRAKQEWFIRRTLELGVVDSLFENVKKADIQKMRSYARMMEDLAVDTRDSEMAYEYLMCDNAFHAVTYYVAGQNLAGQIVQNTMAHYNRVRILADIGSSLKKRTTTAHQKLIKCIEKKDKEGYRTLLMQHLGYFEEDIKNIEAANPSMFARGKKDKKN
ncbi:MAG: GntR family transcriptional regulator [Lachnospiraceae bacterium]|nr:GntR family transcriptional regulator [Lachnospiraceae bacterium]